VIYFKLSLDSQCQVSIPKEIILRYIKLEIIKAVICYILETLADLGQGLVMTFLPSNRRIHKERVET